MNLPQRRRDVDEDGEGNGDNSHDTCDKNTDNSELLPLRQMQPPHGRTRQNQNNQIQQNRQTSKKYDERDRVASIQLTSLINGRDSDKFEIILTR